ncbi:hypothetical protein ACWGNN_00905 [Streptomyces sp. NPDC055817]
MSIAITTLFLLVCIGLGIWFKKDSSFRPREFIAVSVFWVLAVATPWGATVVKTAQDVIGSGVQSAANGVNNVSSK